jgi:hypothetical protein
VSAQALIFLPLDRVGQEPEIQERLHSRENGGDLVEFYRVRLLFNEE